MKPVHLLNVKDALVINLYPIGPVALMDSDEVHHSITELLECSKVSPLDLDKISGFLSPNDNDPDVQRGALELLEQAAESEKENFTKSMPVTFDRVVCLLSSPNVKVHWGALYVLKFFFLSGYEPEAVDSVVHSVLRHLQSPESDVQLASVEVLDAAARSEAIEVVAPTVPALVGLLSSGCTEVRDAALRVLIIIALEPKLISAFRSTLNTISLQNFPPLLSTDNADIEIAALHILEDRARLFDDTLVEAVTSILPAVVRLLSSTEMAIRIAAQKVLDAIEPKEFTKAVTATSPALVEPPSSGETGLSPEGSSRDKLSIRIFALVIGINRYPGLPSESQLKGAVPDADAVVRYLNDTFTQPNITYLRDAAATREGIINAFRSLIDNVDIQRDDPIFIYYAGYGARVKKPTEWDCWMPHKPYVELLCPSDMCNGPEDSSICGIPDRTVVVLLAELSTTHGDNIVSCTIMSRSRYIMPLLYVDSHP